jgi:hypothetical protein
MATYFCFEVRLLEVEPPIWRKFLIASTASFQDLHGAIQDAAGWEDDHLFQFQAGERGPVIASVSDDDSDDPDAARVKLSSFFGPGGKKKCQYLYDFGDSWLHEVELVSTVENDEKFKRRLLDGGRAFPPEDCGGVGGYERYVELLKTGSDPYGEDPEEVLEWLGDWKPEDFDVASVKKKFDRTR